MDNLDFLAAQYGQELGYKTGQNDKVEGAINSSLDILHRNGIYAMMLWLHEDKEGREPVGSAVNKLLGNDKVRTVYTSPTNTTTPVSVFYNRTIPQDALNDVREKLTENLQTMFFVKDLIDRMLVYARHSAKVTPATTGAVREHGHGH